MPIGRLAVDQRYQGLGLGNPSYRLTHPKLDVMLYKTGCFLHSVAYSLDKVLRVSRA